jgi:hypothetical protein
MNNTTNYGELRRAGGVRRSCSTSVTRRDTVISGHKCEQVSLRVMLLTSSYAFVHVTEPTRYKADYIPSNVAPLFYHYSVIMQHLLSDSLFSLISRENLQSNYTTETFEMSVIFQSYSRM